MTLAVVGDEARPRTFEEAAQQAADQLYEDYNVYLGGPSLDAFESYLTPLIAWVNSGGQEPNFPWHEMTFLAGCAVSLLLENTVLSVPEVADLVIQKQHDYGADNILRFGMRGVVVRLSDKAARLSNLLDADQGAYAITSPIFESIEDTYMDIIGYVLIARMLYNETFELPLEKDAEDFYEWHESGGPTPYIEEFGEAIAKNLKTVEAATVPHGGVEPEADYEEVLSFKNGSTVVARPGRIVVEIGPNTTVEVHRT